jgi:hypothetical protein
MHLGTSIMNVLVIDIIHASPGGFLSRLLEESRINI